MSVKKTEATEEIVITEQIEQKFALRKMQANCMALFGVSSSTFAGATVGLSGEHTVNEIKETIEIWKKKGVK